METSASAGLFPSIFMTQSYSGKIVVTICNLFSPSASPFAVPEAPDAHAVRKPAVIMAEIMIIRYFFMINLR